MSRQGKRRKGKIFDRFRNQSKVVKDWSVYVYEKGSYETIGWEDCIIVNETEANARKAAEDTYRAEHDVVEGAQLGFIMTDKF